MTALVMAYDVEYAMTGSPRDGPEGFDTREIERIAEIHLKYNAPGTFFIVGKLLENTEIADRLKKALSNKVLEVASHTYTHIVLKGDHKPSLEKIEFEVQRTNELIAQVFGRECIGLRSPSGFYQGLKGEPSVLGIMWRNGIRYLSTDLRGVYGLLPSSLEKVPYFYVEEGYPDLLELPGHSWQDNVLKAYTAPAGILWPPPPGSFYPQRPPQTPEEEFKVYRYELDYSIERKLPYYSPIIHPWSLGMMDKTMKVIDWLISYARNKGITLMNYRQTYEVFRERH
jgi:peptidoglycan/xylan/chitin deacetylase (PgdA/CDA1 family)